MAFARIDETTGVLFQHGFRVLAITGAVTVGGSSTAANAVHNQTEEIVVPASGSLSIEY